MNISPISNISYTSRRIKPDYNNEPHSEFKEKQIKKEITKTLIMTAGALSASAMIVSNPNLKGFIRERNNQIRDEHIADWLDKNEQVQADFNEDPEGFVEKTKEVVINKPIKEGSKIGICTYMEGRTADEADEHAPFDTVTYYVPYEEGYQIAYQCSDIAEKDVNKMNLDKLKEQGKLDLISVDINQDGYGDFTFEFDENGDCVYESIDLDADGYSDISSDNQENEMVEFHSY